MKAVKASMASYEKRNDRFRIESIAKEYKDSEIRDMLIANYMADPKWTPFDPQTISRFQKYKAYKDSRSYHFTQEVRNLYEVSGFQSVDEVFAVVDGQSLVMEAWLSRAISTDTFVILDMIHPFMGELLGSVVFAALLRPVVKYAPFVKVDISLFKDIEITLQEEVFVV